MERHWTSAFDSRESLQHTVSQSIRHEQNLSLLPLTADKVHCTHIHNYAYTPTITHKDTYTHTQLCIDTCAHAHTVCNSMREHWSILRPLAHVPDADALVLRVTHDQLLPGMEDAAGHVVVVTATRVHLPCLRFWDKGANSNNQHPNINHQPTPPLTPSHTHPKVDHYPSIHQSSSTALQLHNVPTPSHNASIIRKWVKVNYFFYETIVLGIHVQQIQK